MTEERREDDALERLLHNARPVAPEGRSDRILASLSQQDTRRQVYWLEVGDVARRALLASAAGLLLAAGFMWSAFDSRETTVEPVAAVAEESLDEITQVALANQPIEVAFSRELQAFTGERD